MIIIIRIENKVRYFVLGAATLAGALIPVAGNAIPGLARKVINAVLKKLSEILKLIKELHINHPWWVIAAVMSFIKVFGNGKVAELVTNVVNTLNKMIAGIKDKGLRDSLNSSIGVVKTLTTITPQHRTKIQDFVNKNIA